LKYSKEALDIFENKGDESKSEDAKNDLAIAYHRLERFSEAIEVRKQLVEEGTRKYGAKHRYTLTYKFNLGYSYQQTEDWSKAEELFREAWSARKELDKPMSQMIRIYQNALAEVLRDSGKDLEQAEKLFKEMLDFKTKRWGELDYTVQLTAIHYARCLELRGSISKALEIYNKAYPILLQVYGENDRNVRSVRSWIKSLNKRDERKE